MKFKILGIFAGHSSNFCDKIKYYKTLTEDAQVISVFDDITNSLENLKNTLSNML